MKLLPTLPIVLLPIRPRTAGEARTVARGLNADANRRRAQKATAQAARERAVEELSRRARGGSVRGRANDVSPLRIYRERSVKVEGADQPRSPVEPSRRPRSFAELARRYYSRPDHFQELIGTTPRGGTP